MERGQARRVGRPARAPDRRPSAVASERWPFDERFDVEELWFRRALLIRPDLVQGRAQSLLHEALEVFLRLPDVVDVPALV